MSVPYLSVSDIVAAGRQLPEEFFCRLTLAAAGAEITVRCREILRLLPGRRLVARAEMEGRSVVLKLFLGAEAARYCRREARGCGLLAAAAVATPALLGRVSAPASAAGSMPGAAAVSAEGLLFDYLSDARPVTGDAQSAVIAAAAQLARLHQAGCRHRDLHLDNFLLAAAAEASEAPEAPGVFLIDGDGVRQTWSRRPLGRRASVDNLAVLCAQRSPLADAGLTEVYAAYAAERGWRRSTGADAAGAAALSRATGRQRRMRVRRYLQKAQRDCSDYRCVSTWRQYLICVRGAADEALAAFLVDPEVVFGRGEMVKAGNSATVVRLRLGARSCIVKRYNRKTWWHALRRSLQPTPRFRLAWLNGQWLHFLGIPTARPLALLERRFGPLRGVAYLVMEDLGPVDLAAEVAARGVSAERLAQVVRLFQALRAAQLRHGDTKASNFIVTAGDVGLVDLDAMRTSVAGQAEDVRRFLANFDDRPDIRARFATAFTAVGIDPPPS